MDNKELHNTPCSVCRDVLQNQRGLFSSHDGEFRYDHHKTAESLQRSSKQSCYICATTWTCMSPSQREEAMNADYIGYCTTLSLLGSDKMAPGSEEHKDSVFLIIEVNKSDKILAIGVKISIASVMFLMLPSENMEDYNSHQLLETSTGSSTSLALVETWFQVCLKTHKRCNSLGGVIRNWYPTRLLDLGPSKDPFIRLIDTRNTPPEGHYMTLSHRWGTSQFIQLKSSSLLRFQQSIPPEDLPKTFLEAIEITRYLGARYIWIDSLCIMQDSRADWLNEAGLMQHVYSSSLCNISATHGRDSSTGLFSNRDPTLLYPCEIFMSWGGAAQSKHQVHDTSFWSNEVSGAPLNQRAWVVQERLLAPRVLHFSTGQLLWECRELDAAEMYPSGLPLVLASGQAFYKSLDPLFVDEKEFRVDQDQADHDHHEQLEQQKRWTRPSRDREMSIFHGWLRILEAYSNSLLTKPEDKLIALSGIVSKMQDLISGSSLSPPDNDGKRAAYGAGLWLHHLPNQLLWFVKDCRQCNGEPSVRRDLPYRAPSFSWASVDGSVTPGWFNDPDDTVLLAEVIEVFIEPETSNNPAGPVNSGFVKLRGMLKKLQLSRIETMSTMWNMIVDGVLLDPNDYDVDEPRIFSPQVMLDVDQPIFDEKQQARLYCMPVEGKPAMESGNPEPNNKHQLRTLMGLVLEADAVTAPRQFKRIGVFAANRQIHINQLIAPGIKGGNNAFPCEVYDEKTTRSTVHII